MSDLRFPRPAVLRSLPPSAHAVIEASAGTGKTYTLEHLVIELLLRTGTPLEQILVVTFTEKAAAELRARLRAKLEEIVRAEATPDGTDPDEAWTIDAGARERLTRALMSFDAASISTIHGFCHRMLAEHAFDNHRLFSESLVDGRTAFSRAFYSVLRTRLAKEDRYLGFLEAWLDTSPLDELVALLFDAHSRRGALRPALRLDRLHATLEQCKKLPLAANALRPALKKARAPAPQLQAILRRVTLLERMLTRYHRDGRLAALLAELSDAEHELRNSEGLLPYLTDRLGQLVAEQGVLQQLRDGLGALAEEVVPLESAIVQVFLPEVQKVLEADKAKRGELDFDDMLALLDHNLGRPGGEALQSTLRSRFRFALIDEFQDTDEVQWRIFRRLFVGDGAAGRLFVIGDPKQAIYGFRGADVKTYLTARDELTAAGGNVVHLTQNFRSSAALLEAVNLILDQGKRAPFFNGDIRYDHPVTCGDARQSGLTIAGREAPPVHLVRVRPRRRTLAGSAARRTLAETFARHIKRLLDPAQAVTTATRDGARALAPSDIYVLTRTTKEGLEVGRHLRRAGVPHAFYKQDGLFQTREADDVRAVLAAVAEPHRRSRRVRAWQSPFFSVPLEALGDCRDLPGHHPFVERLLEWKALASAKDYDRLFTRIVQDSGIIERELFLEDSERELTNYLHIFEILQEQASRSRGTLQDILHLLTAFMERRRLPEGEDGNVQRLESEREAVQIMTMHKAKGLEAPVVFLFGGYDAVHSKSHIFHEDDTRALWIGPNPPDPARIEAEEEDQRLVYVALTRAKARLYMPYFGFAPEPGVGADAGHGPREFERLNGAYTQLNAQLDDVVARLGESDIAGRFGYEEVDEVPFFRDAPDPGTLAPLEGWFPDAGLLVEPQPDPGVEPLRAAHAGRVVTSYSRIKAAKGGYHAPGRPLDPTGGDEIVTEVHAATVSPGSGELPGGTGSGRFIHEMLEEVDLQTVREAEAAAVLGEDPAVRELFLAGLEKYDRDSAFYEASVALVHTTLTAPLPLGPHLLEGGLVAADRLVREMEFLFPIPEPTDPALGAPAAGPWGARRGFVKGFVDLVFEWQGRTYLLDYKTDLLPSYAPEDLVEHVGHNYAVQAELYTLALVKVLGIADEAEYEARFGGAVYTFVRGMRTDEASADGVYFTRPTWADVQASEASLRTQDLSQGAP